MLVKQPVTGTLTLSVNRPTLAWTRYPTTGTLTLTGRTPTVTVSTTVFGADIEGDPTGSTTTVGYDPGTLSYVFTLVDSFNNTVGGPLTYASIPVSVTFHVSAPGTYTVQGKTFDQFNTQIGSTVVSNAITLV